MVTEFGPATLPASPAFDISELRNPGAREKSQKRPRVRHRGAVSSGNLRIRGELHPPPQSPPDYHIHDRCWIINRVFQPAEDATGVAEPRRLRPSAVRTPWAVATTKHVRMRGAALVCPQWAD